MSTLEAPADSTRRGLSKLRRSRKDRDSDKNSSTSSLVPPPDDANSGLRASIDGAIVKLKDRRRKSSDADARRGSADSTTHSKLSNFPLGRRSRKKSLQKDGSLSPNTNEHRPDQAISPSPSELSLGLEGSGHSSLMTEDSDYEE